MSLSLGEKLREAREERGVSISEVAEQTRISSLYLEAIENDNYKPLPGGIFNKGFVKSYAKFIGLDEQEALRDYARLATENEIANEHDLKLYKPEVLTDDTSSRSLLPTILFAGIILALMTGGILFLLNYIQYKDTLVSNTANPTPDANTAVVNSIIPPQTTVPAMTALKVEFRASTEAVSLSSVSDGKSDSALVAAGTVVTFEPKESLKLSYSKSLVSSAQLSINGKPIALPESPQNPRRNAIEFEISKGNLAQIWQTGRISFEEPHPQEQPTTQPQSTPVEATPTASNTDVVVTPSQVPAATRPLSTPSPTPKPTIIVVGSPTPAPAPVMRSRRAPANATPRPTPN